MFEFHLEKEGCTYANSLNGSFIEVHLYSLKTEDRCVFFYALLEMKNFWHLM